MMRQYHAIKRENPDSILLFRMGDFYETFGDDAKIVAKDLDISLTARAVSYTHLTLPTTSSV